MQNFFPPQPPHANHWCSRNYRGYRDQVNQADSLPGPPLRKPILLQKTIVKRWETNKMVDWVGGQMVGVVVRGFGLTVFYQSTFTLALVWRLFYYSLSEPTTGRINNFDLPNRLVSYSFHFHRVSSWKGGSLLTSKRSAPFWFLLGFPPLFSIYV